MNLKPLFSKVIIKPPVQDKEKVTSFGLVIPETIEKEKPTYGDVIAVGKGKVVNGKRIPMEVKVGDKVLFTKYAADEMKIDDEDYLVIEEEKIMAIIKE